MTGRILLATDGRARSSLATEYAAGVAAMTGATLDIRYLVDERLLRAVDDEATRHELEADLHELGSTAVEEAASAADGIEVVTDVRTAVPHSAILEASAGAELTVLGRAVEDGGPLSVTARVISNADVPVLSVPESAPEVPTDGFERVVVPTDGSDYPARALAAIDRWLADGARVHGVYVVDADIYDLADAPRSIIGILREGGEGALADLAEILADDSVRYRRHVRRGRVTPTLLDAIGEVEAGLVAMGSRGQTTGEGRLIGSTTRALLRSTSVPVLAAP